MGGENVKPQAGLITRVCNFGGASLELPVLEFRVRKLLY